MSSIKYKIVRNSKKNGCVVYEFTSGEFKNNQFFFSNIKELKIDGEKFITIQVNPINYDSDDKTFDRFRADAMDVLAQVLDKTDKVTSESLPL